MIKKVLWILFALFLIIAGLNHFINPGFYLPLIPPYLPWNEELNIISGMLEIIMGFGLLMPRFRRYAAMGIMLLIVLFIPAHIYFIQMGSCVPGGLCTPQWVAWVRLIVIQPLFILWAWWIRKV